MFLCTVSYSKFLLKRRSGGAGDEGFHFLESLCRITNVSPSQLSWMEWVDGKREYVNGLSDLLMSNFSLGGVLHDPLAVRFRNPEYIDILVLAIPSVLKENP